MNLQGERAIGPTVGPSSYCSHHYPVRQYPPTHTLFIKDLFDGNRKRMDGFKMRRPTTSPTIIKNDTRAAESDNDKIQSLTNQQSTMFRCL